MARAGVRVPFRINAVDRRRRTWAWTARVAGARLSLEHDLSRTDGGTRAGLTLTGPALLVAPYAVFTRWPLHRLLVR